MAEDLDRGGGGGLVVDDLLEGLLFAGQEGVVAFAHHRGRAEAEVGVDQFALDLPGQIVGEGFDQEEVAGFGDDGHVGLSGCRNRVRTVRTNFFRTNDEVILPFDQAGFVVVEVAARGSLRAPVNLVDLSQRQDALIAHDNGLDLDGIDGDERTGLSGHVCGSFSGN